MNMSVTLSQALQIRPSSSTLSSTSASRSTVDLNLSSHAAMRDTCVSNTSDVDKAEVTNATTTFDLEERSSKKRSRPEAEAEKEKEVTSLNSPETQQNNYNQPEFERQRKRLQLHPRPHARYLPWCIVRPYMNCEFTRVPVPGNTIALGIVHDSDCPICHHSLSELSGLYQAGDARPKSGIAIRHGLACHHNGCGRTFHRACFINWDNTMVDEGMDTTCPVCRKIIRERFVSHIGSNSEVTHDLFPQTQGELEGILNRIISQDITAAIRSTLADPKEDLPIGPPDGYASSFINQNCDEERISELLNLQQT